MTFAQWELMLSIYQEKRPSKHRCHKKIIESLIKRGWVQEFEDGTVEVTELGLERAKEEIASLY